MALSFWVGLGLVGASAKYGHSRFKGFQRDVKVTKIGASGEQQVSQDFARYRGQGAKEYHDVMLPTKGGRTTQLDHIFVTTAGVFVVETKNYSGKIYGQQEDHNWTAAYGAKKFSFYNPVKQNEGHIKHFRLLLDQAGLSEVPLHSLLVFSAKADLSSLGTLSLPLLQVGEVADFLSRQPQNRLSAARMVQVNRVIEAQNIKGSKARKTHVKGIKAKYQKSHAFWDKVFLGSAALGALLIWL